MENIKNKYLKKWFFNIPFSWEIKKHLNTYIIDAVFEGFVNTEHNCHSREDLPNSIDDFKIKIWTKPGEGYCYHGKAEFVSDKSERNISTLCGKMRFKNIFLKDSKEYINPENILDPEEDSFKIGFLEKEIYNFPELETVLKNDDIRTTEFTILEDGWKRLKEEDRYEKIVDMRSSCENILFSINLLESTKCDLRTEESIKILSDTVIQKSKNLFLEVFGYSAKIHLPKKNFEKPKDYFYYILRYISENY